MENNKKTESQNNSSQFMSLLNDPSQIINSTKFSLITSGTQFIALLFFAVIGASISFKFQNFGDLLNLDYWVSVVVLVVEQLYAYKIGYDLGRSLMISANEELKITNEQIEDLVEGVYDDDDKEIIRPLKKDSSYIEPALNELMNQSKIEMVKSRMKELVEIFKGKLDYFESLKRNTFLFSKRIKISKKMKKRFWRKATAIAYCQSQITNGNKMVKDDEAILSVPDNNVPGFQRLGYADIVSSQSDKVNLGVSKYWQKNETEIKSKAFGKMAVMKLGMAMIGPAILFGALGGSQAFGMIIYSIFLLTIQLAGGFKFGSSNVSSIVLYNTVNRLQAIKDIQRIIPKLKIEEEKLAKEKELKNIKLEELKIEKEIELEHETEKLESSNLNHLGKTLKIT